ncbi:uncharacterized protein B0H18DRAFT_960166 [Fomitopsis serialis]|uniref:uncharacterized protein n=1 Tax=Fomitopsis serialis TaxID=139415 RepID=UPI00200852EC|nr:uncharacterized protein B0H18DRAFT_960166 [Neoantrodia serialis]KAH9913735.1 hypothetical protein B0H18DRAFT_960166 [Neoantrodia serialis]
MKRDQHNYNFGSLMRVAPTLVHAAHNVVQSPLPFPRCCRRGGGGILDALPDLFSLIAASVLLRSCDRIDLTNFAPPPPPKPRTAKRKRALKPDAITPDSDSEPLAVRTKLPLCPPPGLRRLRKSILELILYPPPNHLVFESGSAAFTCRLISARFNLPTAHFCKFTSTAFASVLLLAASVPKSSLQRPNSLALLLTSASLARCHVFLATEFAQAASRLDHCFASLSVFDLSYVLQLLRLPAAPGAMGMTQKHGGKYVDFTTKMTACDEEFQTSKHSFTIDKMSPVWEGHLHGARRWKLTGMTGGSGGETAVGDCQ